jgi:hypothetical protein
MRAWCCLTSRSAVQGQAQVRVCYAAMKEGIMSEDEVVNQIMGYGDRDNMTEAQEKYRDKLKEKIAMVPSRLHFNVTVACWRFE